MTENPTTIELRFTDWGEARITFKGNGGNYQAFKKQLRKICSKYCVNIYEGYHTEDRRLFLSTINPENLKACKKKITAYCTKRNIELTN